MSKREDGFIGFGMVGAERAGLGLIQRAELLAKGKVGQLETGKVKEVENEMLRW